MKVERRRGERGLGQSLVEFALVFPIALLLILGVFDIGRAVFIYNGLTNAAREGARLAVVNQDKPSIAQRVQDMSFATEVTNLGDLNDLVGFYKEQPDLTDPTNNPTCSPMATGCVAVVIARSTWTAITPIVGTILGPLELQARSELPIEFVCPNPNIPAYATAAGCPKQP